jgi:hypothetical protein
MLPGVLRGQLHLPQHRLGMLCLETLGELGHALANEGDGLVLVVHHEVAPQSDMRLYAVFGVVGFEGSPHLLLESLVFRLPLRRAEVLGIDGHGVLAYLVERRRQRDVRFALVVHASPC